MPRLAVLSVVAVGLASAGRSAAGEAAAGAGARVVADLRSSDPAVRRRGLAALPAALAADARLGPKALPSVAALVRDGEAPERAAATRLLLRVRDPAAVDLWFARLDPAREEDEGVLEASVDAARALADDAPFSCRLADLARDPRAGVLRRALAVEAMGTLEGRAVGLVLATPLPGADWVLESARALALGRRGGRESIPPLLELLDHPDPSPRAHAWEALSRITGERLPARRDAWAAWFEARRAGPLPAPLPDDAPDRYEAAEAAHVPRYYGIPIRERTRVVFCLDVSQSMAGRGIADARRELVATVKDMTTRHAFDVLAFNQHVMPWAGRTVRAHPVAKARFVAWLEARETLAYTNIYDAVERAFAYMGRGRHPVPVPRRLDAVFLLSDGAPNRGRFHVPDQVVREIAALSQRQVPVHTIGVGDEVFPLLREIARATGGTFVDAFQ